MRKVAVILVIMLFLATALLPGCSGRKAEELYKTAQFEEVQTNWEHAGQLYERIVADYPGSDQAGLAKARLAALAAEGKYPVDSLR